VSEAEMRLTELARVLDSIGPMAVAVSGGVDSLTLATFAHRRQPGVQMFHAVSPAVPGEATARVRAFAQSEGWNLIMADAGEFADADYMRNPVNRCFYCKTNLYGTLAPRTSAQIVSGTNLDDLGEYRPGLEAAKNHQVRHPFVEAGISKAAVRAIARHLGLAEVSELPSAPCLSSRIETGIAIDPAMLGLVHAAEQWVTNKMAPRTVRCRVRAKGVVIELDEDNFARLDVESRGALQQDIGALFRDGGFDYPVTLAPYRNGSAFLVRMPQREKSVNLT
jgi:pyridinium-3,5-biscarboxylic acid mononucleotide sulfurtransferase